MPLAPLGWGAPGVPWAASGAQGPRAQGPDSGQGFVIETLGRPRGRILARVSSSKPSAGPGVGFWPGFRPRNPRPAQGSDSGQGFVLEDLGRPRGLGVRAGLPLGPDFRLGRTGPGGP